MKDIRKHIPKIITISGILIIVLGLITILIPSLATPKYRLYKNSNDVTNLYLAGGDEESYTYSLSNPEDSSFFDINYAYDIEATNNILGSVNVNRLYANNSLSSDRHNISLYLSFVVDIEDGFEEMVNNSQYKVVELPSLCLSSTLEDKLSSSLLVNGDNLAYTFSEVKFDFQTSDIIDEDLHIYINSSNNLTFVDENENYYRFELSVIDIDLLFFVG